MSVELPRLGHQQARRERVGTAIIERHMATDPAFEAELHVAFDDIESGRAYTDLIEPLNPSRDSEPQE